MRTLLICTTALVLPGVVGGCKKEDETPTTAAPSAAVAYPVSQTSGSRQPPDGRTPASAPATDSQSLAPPVATQPPTRAPSPMPRSAAPGQMAVPGPLASTCQNDVPCGTHYCNMAYGKCAFPSQTHVDCLAPNAFITGFFVPAPVPQP